MPRRKYWRKARVPKKQYQNEPQSDMIADSEHDQISTVCGNFHQGHRRFFPNCGVQCVANSCSAILYDKIKPISHWTGEDLDAVLIAGDELYSLVRPTLPAGQMYLLVSEIPDVVTLHGSAFSVRQGESVAGYVLGNVALDMQCDIFMPLADALETTFSKFNSCLITFMASTFAVMSRGHHFYVVDSHSRNADGMQSGNGTSIMIRYRSQEEVNRHCTSLAVSLNAGEYDQFEITGFDATLRHTDCTDSHVSGKDFDVSVPNACEVEGTPEIPAEEDISIVRTTEVSRAFCTLSEEDQAQICEKKGLFRVPEVVIFKPSSFLGEPCSTIPIEMDGNCFFRALSCAVTGTENNHRKLRLLTVKHLLENSSAFSPFLRPGYHSVKEYVQLSRMKYLHTWATEMEILSAADMLQTDIFTYASSWLLYSRLRVYEDCRNSERAIYLHHVAGSHYDVVVCVKNPSSDICSGNCSLMSGTKQQKNQEADGISGKKRKISDDSLDCAPKIHCFGKRRKRELQREYKHQRRMESASKMSVAALQCHEKRSFSRYASDESYRRTAKASSKKKYAIDKRHKKLLKLYSVQKYETDEIHQNVVKQYSKRKYATDPVHQKNVKTYSKTKYAIDPVHQKNVKACSKTKYATDPLHQKNVKTYSKTKYGTDLIHKENVKTYSKKKYATNQDHQTCVRLRSKCRYMEDEKFRENLKSQLQLKYSVSESYRKIKKNRSEARRQQMKLQSSCIVKAMSSFRKQVTDAPQHICTCCNRRFFRRQVLLCKLNSYCKKGKEVGELADKCISKEYLHRCSAECDLPCSLKMSPHSKLWICYTCHRKILSGRLPAEASVNNLYVEPVPKELSCLNQLEQHLIAKHIPFAKVAALPKGGQKGVHGPVVCVPSSIEKTISSLPRPESDDQLIRVKLKRKLSYKGHYKYQFVNTARIEKALRYLKENNCHYHDVSFNSDWVNSLSSVEECSDDNESETESLPNLENVQPDGENLSDTVKFHAGNSDNIDNTDQLDTSHTGDHGLVMDSCLQPVDIGQEILDQHADKILCLAPAEGNDPVKVLMNEENEAKSFPVLFPKGSPTYHDDREERITMARYLNTRLMHADSRFAKNTEYIFYAQYLSEVYQVLSSVSVALRKSHLPDLEGKLTPDRLTDHEALREILKCDSGYKFLKPIRGTPAYWQSAQKDLFAMLRQLGTPTWFCSFSAADMRWPEFIEALLKDEGSDLNIDDLDWAAKCELIRGNPVTAARMFEHRFHCFLKEFILSSAHPIGKVIDYFYRVEFQHRGSPHTHCLFWVEGAPKFDQNSDDEVTAFIDQYVTCEMPSSDDEELHEIVTSVQTHSSRHSKSCKKKGTTCRFNFPRPPSKCTFISRPGSSDVDITVCSDEGPITTHSEMTKEMAKQILENLWKALADRECTFETTDELFEAIGIDQGLFEEAYSKLSRRASIVLERCVNDVWINQYNPHLLRAWNGNMDIQYVLDAYSCIVYIISYISKAEREMGCLLEQARKETLNGNEDAKHAMKKLGGVYLHTREVSAQEAVFRVCNLHLKECSRFVQFIPVGDAVKMSLPLQVLRNRSKGHELALDDMWMTSIIDRYKNRPDTYEFETMCLATFCSEFRVLSRGEVSCDDQEEKGVFKLKSEMGYIRRRTRTNPAIVRYPRFSQESQPEKYYQSILQLFLPHRSDIQLKPKEFDSFEDFFAFGAVRYLDSRTELVQLTVNRNKALFEKDPDEIERAEEMLEKCGELEDAWAQICPETEAERIACSNEKTDKSTDPLDESDMPDLLQEESRNYTVESRQELLSDKEAKELLRSLNEKQRQVFYKVRQWCLQKKCNQNPEPFYLFVTGGAGTGKTHLIRSLQYEASRISVHALPNPDDVSVLVTAPTGVAAFNIGASTIHTTFAISVDAKLPYQPLGEEKLNTLRAKLESLQILVIDEISMVDHKLLVYIHGRLRQIKQCRDYSPFGKVSVIAVGDFYQLPPVKGKPLYKDDVGFNLWSDNFHIVELTEVMRQKDRTFADTLNRLRTRTKAEKISPGDINLLAKRETGEELDDIHIFATNQQVKDFNLIKLSTNENEIVSFEAEDFEKDQKTGKLKKRDSQFITTTHTNLARKISLAVGARVLLMKNIDVSDGLVNGVFGTVSHIPCPTGSETAPPVIYVVFDSDRVGNKLRKKTHIPEFLPSNSTPISRAEDRVNTIGGIRRQFPLVLSFACTVHKLQGVTLDKAVVSMDRIFSAGQAYVALSRVRSLEGLTIQNFNDAVIYCNEKITNSLSSMTPFLDFTPGHSVDYGVYSEASKIILHNVQGLRCHISDISGDRRFTTSEVVCVTETWLSSNDPREQPELDGFILKHKTRSHSYDDDNPMFEDLKQQAHGGVGLFYKTELDCKIVDLCVSNLEYMAALIPKKNCVIIVIYRPLSYRIPLFRPTLDELLVQLLKLPYGCIVVGDFNENILKSSTILELFQKHHFEQHVTEPTTENGTLIDHVYVRNVCLRRVRVIPTYFSHHDAVEIVL